MKITCPKCSASGTLPEHEIPSEGRFLSCPRCKHGFTVIKPRAVDSYVVDTCPACSFSTFGEETFSSCPKCGVLVKAYVERQKEEQLQQKNQQLLNKKLVREDAVPPPPEQSSAPVADFVESLHPVNLIGWGVAVAGVLMMIWGVVGLMEYNPAEIQARLAEQRDEPVSGWYVFFRFGIQYWVRILFGAAVVSAAVAFMKRLKISLKLLANVLWGGIVYVIAENLAGFIVWVLTPIPHSLGGYAVQIFVIIFTVVLIGVPLFMLIQFLDDRKITSVVKL